MSKLTQKKHNQSQRARRVRARIVPNAAQPRLSVHISNYHVTAQIIDDENGKTLAYATTVGTDTKGTLTEKATWTGDQIAKKGVKAKIKKVSFDRGSKLYHGRVKALADAARKAGLEF